MIKIHLTHWEKPSFIDAELIEFGEKLKSVIFETRKSKSQRNLSMRAEIDTLEIKTEERFAIWFKQSEKDILACSRAKEVKLKIM